MQNQYQILGFTGSLRKGSYNRAALRVVREHMSKRNSFSIVDLSDIPFYNEDDDEPDCIPTSVVSFRKQVQEADGLVIATPEYNGTIPPVLKNALDWVSVEENHSLLGKPVALLSASVGRFGGVRAQDQLRQMCTRLDMRVLNKPEVYIGFAHQKFDETGTLIDRKTNDLILRMIATFQSFFVQYQKGI